MSPKLEALCQLADGQKALCDAGIDDLDGVRLGYQELQDVATEIRELQRVVSWPIPVDDLVQAGVKIFLDGIALTPDASGWIEWKGGECPVDPSSAVQVRTRGQPVATYPIVLAWSLKWSHDNFAGDIVAYRVVCNELPADADGWVEWRGGECPVAVAQSIDMRFRDGRVYHVVRNADDLRWWHDGNGGDIIAYRLARPAK